MLCLAGLYVLDKNNKQNLKRKRWKNKKNVQKLKKRDKNKKSKKKRFLHLRYVMSDCLLLLLLIPMFAIIETCFQFLIVFFFWTLFENVPAQFFRKFIAISDEFFHLHP